jgi:hypothetical protein
MEYITGGVYRKIRENPLIKTWGGLDCLNSVPLDTRYKEDTIWIMILILSYVFFDVPGLIAKIAHDAKRKSRPTSVSKSMEIIGKALFALHALVSLHLLWCKYMHKNAVFLLQPCHVILFLQTLALNGSEEFAVQVLIYFIPPLVGAILAIVFPDTAGLSQILEVEAYYVQHVLIGFLTPLYMVYRYSHIGQLITGANIFVGVWILVLYHWVVLESVNVLMLVNVDCMLCPSNSMSDLFKTFPAALLYPSYRTLVCICIALCAWPLAWTLKFIANSVADRPEQESIGGKPKKM